MMCKPAEKVVNTAGHFVQVESLSARTIKQFIAFVCTV